MYPEISEAERFPMLSPRGRMLLNQMRQHRHAPNWNWPNGEQLNEAGLAKVKEFDQRLRTVKEVESLDEPAWLNEFVDYCLREVPYYRARSRPGTALAELPTCKRADLAPRVWEFVPNDVPVDDLVVFSSSGTTGYPTRTPHHPVSAACGIPLIEHALRTLHNVELLRGPELVAIANVAAYPGAFTTAIVVSCLEEAGCIRVNLDPSAWRQPDDCHQYLNAWKAPIWLGDPVAFGALEGQLIDYAPTAIVSSIMHLADGYANHLRAKYGCPVLDLYAMTEAGIISVRDENGHRILAPDLYVEVLDEEGNRCPPGVCGEITLTGGRNPFLPLLRYRTGDFAALQLIDGRRTLLELSGRHPVEYPAETGRIVHSMEIVRLMRTHPVRRYEVRKVESGYEFVVDGDVNVQELEKNIQELLGSSTRLVIG